MPANRFELLLRTSSRNRFHSLRLCVRAHSFFLTVPVIWRRAVDSLEAGNAYLRTSKEARYFLEKYMQSIIGILSDQQPAKIGNHERQCVTDSLFTAVVIVANDLDVQIRRKGQSVLFETLNVAFSRKKAFYKGSKGNWNSSQTHGLPEIRLKVIERFRQKRGFELVRRYMSVTVGTPFFPRLETVNQVLIAACDAIQPGRAAPAGAEVSVIVSEMENDALNVAEATMSYISVTSDEELKKVASEMLSEILSSLVRIFDRVIVNRREETYQFYAFWRALALKMIRSQSLPLKLAGWSQVDDLIEASAKHRPPPRSFVVTQAGCAFANGPYEYNGQLTGDGYSRPGCEISYVRKIPVGVEPGGGKKLTLFRCTMRSQQKWWFLSEADEEQPGTDRDIDYYQHKSKEHEEAYPPPDGWVTCRTAGVDPPPHVEPVGLVVPPGQEFETLEHQLAKWAISNEIVEQVLGDTTIHREVVSRSTPLIKFLAEMCDRYPPPSDMSEGPEQAQYCLQASHLLFAWKTCLRKADAAVSSQVYNLLVSILPLCPSSLAIPLLQAVQSSLQLNESKRDYLFEVSEFCSALASGNFVDSRSGATVVLKEEVREEALNLMWSVLTHGNACDPRTYEALKRYVEVELRIEPKGSEHRQRFMKYCVDALASNTTADGAVDEGHATLIVRLSHFILDVCPRVQALTIVSNDEGALPRLLFNELRMYLLRRKNAAGSAIVRKASNSLKSAPESDTAQLHAEALAERLKILRQVFGLTDRTIPPREYDVLSYEMVETLWQLCDSPKDRAALMIFIASASRGGNVGLPNPTRSPLLPAPSDQLMSAAFDEIVARSVFLNLFCSESFNYEHLGDGAYKSFQFLFGVVRNSPSCSLETQNVALDALWRICLTVEDVAVASQARKDLLQVYITLSPTSLLANGQSKSPEQMVTDEKEGSRFIDRILDILSRVKSDLEAGEASAFRSTDRCLRVLNAAIGQSSQDIHSITSSTLVRLLSLDHGSQLEEVLKCVPHGMRSQAAYRRVGVVAKRPNPQGASKDQGLANSRLPSPVRFPLDLHPLETITSVKDKVARACQCALAAVKLVQISGRAATALRPAVDSSPSTPNLNLVPEDTVVDELGIVDGCEIMFVITASSNMPIPPPTTSRGSFLNDLSSLFYHEEGRYADKLFSMVLGTLKSLPWEAADNMNDSDETASRNIQQLAWDFLLAMPTNPRIEQGVKTVPNRAMDETSVTSEDDPMDVDLSIESWNQLLDVQNFDRSVYVLLTIDSLLRPIKEVVSILPSKRRDSLQSTMDQQASEFRRSFVEAGGFSAVVRFFAARELGNDAQRGRTRRGNAVALRILKSCLFGNVGNSFNVMEEASPDDIGGRLLTSLSDAEGLLNSLMSMVVDDPGISSSTITDVLRFLRLLLQTPAAAQTFVSLPNGLAERFLAIPLMHDEGPENTRSSAVSAALVVRRSAHDLILQTSVLADSALPWLVKSMEKIDVSSESTAEYFDVLEHLVADGRSTARSGAASEVELESLGLMVCKKLASCSRPTSESETYDFPTGVLCGCLKLLRALVENGGPRAVRLGLDVLLSATGVVRWSSSFVDLEKTTVPVSTDANSDAVLIDLMGCVFDGFLSPDGNSSVSICCDKESRHRGFEVVSAVVRSCRSKFGFLALVSRVSMLISVAAPNLRHRWGQFGVTSNESIPRSKGSSKYSGLRNQGCTCYMNSVLQQLFMMPELRHSMCSAPLPSRLRTSGAAMTKGMDIVGKRISLQWENGVSYEAIVEGYDEDSGAHRIRYCTTSVATQGRYQIDPEELSRLPPQLPDEFIISEGRPGKETGVFEISKVSSEMTHDGADMDGASGANSIAETQDEAASRHLLEEVQKTFIHLDEGSRGRCFDPRSLVEACACLKLEFDVWQQNDASEFTTKLLDRLEIALKKYAPDHFKFLDHTFGIKVTKQKICKECHLKTNREEKHINIDCQIRGKSDILDALAALTEDEIMEGSNRVFCDNCKKNTDTILRTAISTLPNMLILSLKRFDLDFNTFETVKLNSRCSFGETLNLKPFTLEGLEAMENTQESADPDSMETDDERQDSSSANAQTFETLPNDEYEYKLVGVLVHAGVAQGGHYYSFIKERYPGSDAKWYRFDDEDVTPFDPSLIETECFGGKIKKEAKWPNGTVHTVEQEQFANALILFYEKVKPSMVVPSVSAESEIDPNIGDGKSEQTSSGYGVFKADVQRSNSTHKWQMFLFDHGFQEFMKHILRLAFEPSEQLDASADHSWRQEVVLMQLSFFFDVLLYASDRSFLSDWSRMLKESLLMDPTCGRLLVYRLAQKTRQLSSNWVRTFLLDCPDQASRAAAAYVFAGAIKSCLSYEKESLALERWCLAWEEQVKTLAADSPAPCQLEGQFSVYEDVSDCTSESVAPVGTILSFLNVLLEAMPRCSRFSAELNGFVRDLAGMKLEKSKSDLRRAIKVSLIPPRLVAIAARDSLHPAHYRRMFPGSSISLEAAASQMRHETIHNLVSLQGPHMHAHLHNSDTPRGAVQSDYISLLEALANVAGLPGCSQIPLVHDTGEAVRNRRRYALSDAAVQALTTVFNESCQSGAPGMGHRDIENYLLRTRVDAAQFSAQKIQEMLNKYPTTSSGTGVPTPRYLCLDGFLAYYRDTIQSNDAKLRHDLNLLGFRPDLTRRSPSARFSRVGDRMTSVDIPESIALDVAEVFGDHPASFGSIADQCLTNTAQIYTLASSVSEQLSMYLVAGATYLKPADDLIDRLLQVIYQSTNDWAGTETVSHATVALQVIVSLPSPDRERRIGRVMESTTPVARNFEHSGVGLLPVLRHLIHARHTAQPYKNDFHWTYSRYIEIFKNLRSSYPVYLWLNENRQAWAQFERELMDSSAQHMNRQQAHQQPIMQHQPHMVRGGADLRERGANVPVPLDHHGHSDSDLNGMNDSEDEEDSQFGELADNSSATVNDGPYQIVVTRAGNQAVNGVYRQDGTFQDACRYVMEGRWTGEQHRFYIFCCNVSNNTKHWYISIVPRGSSPGTSNDIDFYTAPVNEACRTVPPREGWVKAQNGEDALPILEYRMRPEGVEIAKQLIGTNIRVDGGGGGGFVLGDDVDDDERVVPVFRFDNFNELDPSEIPVVHPRDDENDSDIQENHDRPSRIV
jgi:ubiquitin carboxyl-terminal hydrolase 9/24